MDLPTLSALDFSKKKVLFRADLNVPLADGDVADDQRIKATLPTLNAVLDGKPASVCLCSHLGNPKGEDPALSLAPVARRLEELLERPVHFLGGPLGVSPDGLPTGSVAVLENLRYHPGEKKADPDFATALAAPFDAFVLDAFGALHRAHASIVLVPKLLPSVAGKLVLSEISALSGALANPDRPLYALVGGAKVSSKLGVLRNLVEKVDGLLIGGAMAYTFLRARGQEVGNSLVEETLIPDAAAILLRAAERKILCLLPRDHVVGESLNDPQALVSAEIPAGKMGIDVGPLTRQDMVACCQKAGTVLWNGPVGAFEEEGASHGTQVLTLALQSVEAKVIVGGGDTAAAVARFGEPSRFFHVSTGGGASLELLEGKTLPGVAALMEAIA